LIAMTPSFQGSQAGLEFHWLRIILFKTNFVFKSLTVSMSRR
jgi:hypothetical protein